VLTDGHNSTFYCHVISGALARRGVRRGAAEAGDGVERVGTVTRSSLLIRNTVNAWQA